MSITAAIRPFVLHPGPAQGVFNGVLGAWVVAEVVFQLRGRWLARAEDRKHRSAVEGARSAGAPDLTVLAVAAGVGGGFTLAQVAARHHVAPLPGGGWWPVALGLSITGGGIAFRLWAMVTLGRFFRFVVVIQPGHRVVDRGPYRWVRHPSYTGLLTGALGVGLALDDWAALATTFLLSLAGLLVRIRAEERALLEALGPEYAQYEARTKRLIPGVW